MSYKRTAHIMNILENIPYQRIASFKNEECSICLSLFSEKECVEMKLCKHIYHEVCIKECLKVNHLCPLCRKDVYKKEENCCIYL
jgi:hypothetical protein